MEPSPAISHLPSAAEDAGYVTDSRGRRAAREAWDPSPAQADEFVASASARRMFRLIVDQRYFGLGARAFHAGAQRMLDRITAQAPAPANIELECLGNDFELEPAESVSLLRAMLAGGLLLPDGTGYYQPTARFRKYALAPLVAPLSRPRAKMLVDAVCDRAAQINADWARNPFEVKMVAVAGSYMSRSDQLPELSLWLVLRSRREKQTRRWRSMFSKAEGLRQILTAVSAPSSFILARIVAHKSVVPRPFSVVFQASEIVDTSVSPSQVVRDWGASLGELLSAGSYASSRRRRRSDRA